jgi:predicted nucleotidyltransferase component of viral defense system
MPIYELCSRKLTINSTWFADTADITTYQFEELVAIKLRDLFSRASTSKDLFDVWSAIQYGNLNLNKTMYLFEKYMERENMLISNALFQNELLLKAKQEIFLRDSREIAIAETAWDPEKAAILVVEQLLSAKETSVEVGIEPE